MTFADLHCDTASYIYEKKESLFNSDGHISLEKLKKYDSPIQVFALWLDRKYYSKAFAATLDMIKYFKNEVMKNGDKISIVKNAADTKDNAGRVSAMLSIEGCEALEGDMENLYALYDEGVRMATLTWNYRNCVATGVRESDKGGGLTDFGREAVKEMERLGIIVDVSHLSDEGFYDVERHTSKPFIASHSNCRAICKFPRNLTDDQLRVISGRGGVVGINLCEDFLSDSGRADMDDILRHAERMLDICGENCVCLGCDLDGIPSTPEGVASVEGIEGIIGAFEKNFGKTVAEKIAVGNFMRITGELL